MHNRRGWGYLASGLIVGVLDLYSFGSIYLGEVFLLVLFVLYLLINRKLYLEKVVLKRTIGYLLFIVFVAIQGILQNNTDTEKVVLKYIIVYLEIIAFYYYLSYKGKRCIWLIIGYLISSSTIYYYKNYSSYNIISYIHILPFAICAVIVYSIYIKDETANRLKLCGILIVYSLIGSSRTTLVMALVLIIYFTILLLTDKKRTKYIVFLSLFILIASIVSIYYLVSYLNENIRISTASNNERTLLLNIALTEFKENVVFGVGIDQFNVFARNHYYYFLRSTNLMPHNAFVQMLAEGGLIGFSLFFGGLFIELIKAIKRRSPLATMGLAISANIFFSILSGNLRFLYAVMIAILLYGNIWWESERKSEQSRAVL